MYCNILETNSIQWREILNLIKHDIYHLPEYVALEGKRTNSIPQAFFAIDNDKVFFIPYLMRSCQDILNEVKILLPPEQQSDKSATEIFDVISPYGYPGILLSDAAKNSPQFVHNAFNELKQTFQSHGVCSAFLRLHPILSDNFPEIFPPNSLTNNGETVSIDLSLDTNKIWAQTNRGHQSKINKCKRLGLTARTVTLLDHMDEFLSIYKETMDRVGAQDAYYFNRDYFTDLLKLGDHLHLVIVESMGQIICAGLIFEYYGIVQGHLGGTKTSFLKQSPFNLLVYSTCLWAKERGNKYLHIGGGLGGSKDKLFTFKSGFSKQRHQFFTMRLILDEAKYDRLVSQKAQAKNIPITQLKKSNFFPTYRAPLAVTNNY